MSIGFTTMSTLSILSLLTFIIPALLALLGLKYQKESISVFEAHPITIKTAVASLLVFALAVGIDLIFHFSNVSPICSHLLRTTIMLCGSLLVASFASLLFPDACRPLIYLLLLLGNLHRLIRKWCRWVQQGIMAKFQAVFAGIQEWYVRRNAPLLPLTMRDILHRAHLGANPQPQVPQG